MSGHEVLSHIREDDELGHLPVMILSTSTARSDVEAAYQGHANAYVAKPDDLDGYERIVDGIGRFWFETATLP